MRTQVWSPVGTGKELECVVVGSGALSPFRVSKEVRG